MRPIDAFFRDYLRPPLRRAGFERKGNNFRTKATNGDVAVVKAQSSPI